MMCLMGCVSRLRSADSGALSRLIPMQVCPVDFHGDRPFPALLEARSVEVVSRLPFTSHIGAATRSLVTPSSPAGTSLPTNSLIDSAVYR
jgi:hypothetical protein